MAERSQMYYAYFRFYVDESEIISGMDKFCTGWEHMFAIGYNYHEYKCFVDNLGGFEHWVGDMRGYISQTRDVGFMDGSPSDAVYDASLVMGASRLNLSNFLLLNGICRGSSIYFRKITAQDAGIAHKVKMVCGTSVINHPVMYVLDTTQIEIIKPAEEITDSSDVDSYEFTADLSATLLIGTQTSLSCGTITNPNNMWDYNDTTFTQFHAGGGDTCEVIYDMGAMFTAGAIDLQNHWGGAYFGSTQIYTSVDGITWVFIHDTGDNPIRLVISNNNLPEYRYIKVKIKFSGAGAPRCDIYAVVVC